MGAPSGFREVIVFAGSTSIRPNSTGQWPGSQARQDELLEHVFEGVPSPFYVNLASNDAVSMSSTWRLEFNGTGCASRHRPCTSGACRGGAARPSLRLFTVRSIRRSCF
ncbi:hypothetical protein T492DRAFT_265086 [Pavlovales sp. CCMP2436]|nr:hypothetical protein T492DRAFT_265086 [Pavlovales sp. CCMP2436]